MNTRTNLLSKQFSKLAGISLVVALCHSGRCGPVDEPDGFGVEALIIPDCDGDGKADLIVMGATNFFASDVWVISQDGLRVIGALHSTNGNGDRPISGLVGCTDDLNGDGCPDLLVERTYPRAVGSAIDALDGRDLSHRLFTWDNEFVAILPSVSQGSTARLLRKVRTEVGMGVECVKPEDPRSRYWITYFGEMDDHKVSIEQNAVDYLHLGGGRGLLAAKTSEGPMRLKVLDADTGSIESESLVGDSASRWWAGPQWVSDWDQDGVTDWAGCEYRSSQNGAHSPFVQIFSGKTMAKLQEWSREEMFGDESPGFTLLGATMATVVNDAASSPRLLVGDPAAFKEQGCIVCLEPNSAQIVRSRIADPQKYGTKVSSGGDWNNDGFSDYVVTFGIHTGRTLLFGVVDVRCGRTHELLQTV